ncbi:MAG: hypothetical protein RI560_13475 [Natronomonas sp.]|uniref:hypothetical protein n=1 Tax=Natronomonas sp. TaxID=2184060 RepID=UPI0028701A3B|nr:hypothetical protein [Natronomonas sp.]MDR9382664.1 hypothetical protein [Natronomonas sp.]MDR9431743.1 hypothetical protein [Natronomonas sp.]
MDDLVIERDAGVDRPVEQAVDPVDSSAGDVGIAIVSEGGHAIEMVGEGAESDPCGPDVVAVDAAAVHHLVVERRLAGRVGQPFEQVRDDARPEVHQFPDRGIFDHEPVQSRVIEVRTVERRL